MKITDWPVMWLNQLVLFPQCSRLRQLALSTSLQRALRLALPFVALCGTIHLLLLSGIVKNCNISKKSSLLSASTQTSNIVSSYRCITQSRSSLSEITKCELKSQYRRPPLNTNYPLIVGDRDRVRHFYDIANAVHVCLRLRENQTSGTCHIDHAR